MARRKTDHGAFHAPSDNYASKLEAEIERLEALARIAPSDAQRRRILRAFDLLKAEQRSHAIASKLRNMATPSILTGDAA